MSEGCTGIRGLIPTCTFLLGRRHTGGQKGNGYRIGERFFGPPCSGQEFPPVPKWEVSQEPKLTALMALSDGAIGVTGARSAVCSRLQPGMRFEARIER